MMFSCGALAEWEATKSELLVVYEILACTAADDFGPYVKTCVQQLLKIRNILHEIDVG